MPTYDYHCVACGHTFERFHSPQEKISKSCPKCRRRRIERQIGAGAGIIFKGSGFYETDYRSRSYEKDRKSEKPASKDKKTGQCSGNPAKCDGPCSE